MPGRSKLDDDQRAELVERYRQGETSGRLAADYGIASHTVRVIVLAAGVSMRPVGRPRKHQPRERLTDDLAYQGRWVRRRGVLRPVP